MPPSPRLMSSTAATPSSIQNCVRLRTNAASGGVAAAAAPARRRLLCEIGQLCVRVAARRRLELRQHVAERRHEHEFAAQLSTVRVEVFLARDHRHHRFAGDRPLRARRPRFRIGDDRIGARRQRVGDEALVLPAAPERERFELHVRQPPLLHRLLRPVGRLLDVRRAGEARSVDVGEIAFELHHLRALQPFFLDPVDRVEVEFFRDRPIRCERADEHGDECSGGEDAAVMHGLTLRRTLSEHFAWQSC